MAERWESHLEHEQNLADLAEQGAMFEGKYRISMCVRRSGVSGLGTSSSLTSVEDTRVDDINLANLEGTQRLSKRDIVAITPRSAAIIHWCQPWLPGLKADPNRRLLAVAKNKLASNTSVRLTETRKHLVQILII